MQRIAREMKKARKRLTKETSFLIVFLVAIYLFLFVSEFPILFRSVNSSSASSPSPRKHQILHRNVDISKKKAVIRHTNLSTEPFSLEISSLSFNLSDSGGNLSKMASVAWEKGVKLLVEFESGNLTKSSGKTEPDEACRASISLSSKDFKRRVRLMVLPCGLTVGSKITVVGKPTKHLANDGPEMNKTESQFIMELQGLKREGEYPPKIFHFNPRLYGDWSRESVIEVNTCYRMQWGSPLRCDGRESGEEEDTVDGKVKCEKWTWEEDERLGKSMSRRILRRWIGQTKKSTDLRYPFVEDRLFVLTLTAGTQGYHVHVDGRHIVSFSYRAGFAIEEATGLTLTGDIEVESLTAEALPASHKRFSTDNHIEMSGQWRSPPLTGKPVDLFIGILSASNHFAERMAVRKTWMQYAKNSRSIVARFFVAMHARNEVNLQLKKEAEFFGDIVIVPFVDNYDLVVLKTIAICHYGVKRVSAKYVMKCDDDTFVRVDSVLEEVKKSSTKDSLYLGNINYFHSPLRDGKWAVTYEEWPGEMYPPYANGPCYVLSSDIANYIIAEFEKDTLKLFKMEDVSVGMWVEKFNRFGGVEYVHDLRYCQFGCIDDYLTAHYQSPRQMICLWDKLQAGKPECCDSR